MIDVEIADPAWVETEPAAEALARSAAEAALAHACAPAESEIAVLLADDDAVSGLNARFRGQHKPTNVLSFPAPENPEGHLGDVALARETCLREAAEQGKSLAAHLQHLVVHGVLHLLGYDHTDDAEAHEMEGLERVVLAGLGVNDPYAAGEGDHG